MTRKYTQKKRAEQQAETRRKIAQAALDLHKVHGPLRTTISMVAEQAGVQRHTFYAHFPDEWSLAMACSGLHMEQDPPPDAGPWTRIPDRRARLRTALATIYAWFERNSDLLLAVYRDADQHELTRKILQERFGPYFASWMAALSNEKDGPAGRAMLTLALSIPTWRTMAVQSGLGSTAADVMADAVIAASGG